MKVTRVAYRIWLVENKLEHYVVYERGKWKCIGCQEYLRNVKELGQHSCVHIRAVWEHLKEVGEWNDVVSAEEEKRERPCTENTTA